MRTFTFLAVLVFLFKSFSVATGPHKLLLTVYYESDCPDSKTFVLRQLQPAIHLLHSYVKLRLIPFGKARSINYGNDGFECQHGSGECFGNIVQDCALNLMTSQSDKMKVAYVACEMQTRAGVQGDLNCVEKAKLPASRVEHCVVANEGTDLQLQSEYHTSLVAPTFIPTVTIDGVFDQKIQDNAQIDLIGTLCSILKHAPPCADHYNSMALRYVLVNQR